MIYNVQMLRAVAATLVVVCHATLFWGDAMPALKVFAFHSGYAGVDLFFVISGFVIANVAHRASTSKSSLRATADFSVNRVARIYPIYWVVLLSTLALALFIPGIVGTYPWPVSMLMMFTLTTQSNPYVTVAWTLGFEMYFYSLVAIVLLVSGKYFRPAILAGALLYACVIAIRLVSGYGIVFFTHPLILDFLMGIGIFYLVSRGWVALPKAFVAIGIIGLAVGTHLLSDGGPPAHLGTRWLYLGATSAALVYGMIGLERVWSAPHWAVSVGNASYSTYLWHWPLIMALNHSPVVSYPSIATSVVVVAVMLCVGALSYRFIEMPIARVLQTLRGGEHFGASRMAPRRTRSQLTIP